MNKKHSSTDGVEILHGLFVDNDPEMKAMLEEERVNAEIAQWIYDLRNEAGLTQAQLSEITGISAEDITRLEESDYEGHTLAMLRRVAKALGKEVRIEVVGECVSKK